MKNFSRRTVFWGLGHSEAKQGTEQIEAAPEPVKLIDQSDADFSAHLASSFPELEDHREFQHFRAFSVLLKNNSIHHIRAYSIHWTYSDAENADFVGEFFTEFIQRHASVTTQNLNVPSGQLRLISPFFNLKPTRGTPRKSLFDQGILNNLPLQRATTASVSLDGVVLSNGDFFGPDKLRLSKRYAALRNAERDEAKSVKYHSSLGSSPWEPASINALLDSHIEKGKQIYQGFEEVWWQSRRLEAERLKRRLADKGIAHLQECIERRLRYIPVSLNKKT